MIFGNLITAHVGKTIDYPNSPWYAVTVTPEDLKYKIHRHVFGEKSKWDFGKILPNTCLKNLSEFLYENNFDFNQIKQKIQYDDNFDYEVLKNGIIQIQGYYEKLKQYQNIEDANFPWCFIAHKQEGPYMITDGTHRQVASYIYHFLDPGRESFVSQIAYCAIQLIKTENDFGRIPDHFCMD